MMLSKFEQNLYTMLITQQLQEIDTWQAARSLTQHVFQVSKVGSLSEDSQLKNELHQTTLAITNTLAETVCSEQKKFLSKKLGDATQYCIKIKSLMYVIEDVGYLPATMLMELHEKIDQVMYIIQEQQEALSRRLNLGFLLIQF